MDPQWFKDNLVFSLSKYGMSMCKLGTSVEFQAICVNSLWPKTNIATPRLKEHLEPQVYVGSRYPTIMTDAAYQISLQSGHANFSLMRPSSEKPASPTSPLTP
jgi:citronellol/citronellal dehydrogenase